MASVRVLGLLNGYPYEATTTDSLILGTITTGVWNGTKIGLLFGGTNADLSGTGGTSQVLKQVSAGAAITVGQLAASDLSNNTTGSGFIVLATGPTLSNPLVGTQLASDNSTKAASTAYVTSAIATAVSGINPAVAVQAATAAILPNSPTYFNGVSGVGATLTAGVTNTTLVVDGYTPILNDRILVKNQGTTYQNGVYFVSQLAALGQAWIITRTLDYDQPSDINNTGAIPVINGTVNATTSWVLTSAVGSVGIDPLTYTQFGLAPSTIQTTTLTNGHIWIGNGSNIATDNAVTGNVTISNTGVTTIGTAVVTNAMLAGSIAASKFIGTDIATIGTITSGGLGTGAVIGGVTMTLGSDATGDIYYRASTGILTRLGIGSTGNILTVAGGLPSWAAGGAVSSVSNSDGSLTISPITGLVVASINLAHTNVFTTNQNVNLLALGTSTNVGFLVENLTQAALNAQQVSPTYSWSARGWSTGSSASQIVAFQAYVLPIQGATNPTGQWLLQAEVNGASFSTVMSVDTSGNIASATWQGSVIGSTYGGTGVNNGSSTITIGGSVTFSGAHTFSGTLTNNTSVTFPVSGTLATLGTNTFTGIQNLAAGTTSNQPLQWTTGSLLSAVVQGAEEVDANGLKYYTIETTAGRGYVPAEQHFRLTANGGNISTIGNFFGTNSNITLVSGAEYLIEIECYFTNTTAGTVTWTFTNSAAPTLQNIYCKFSPVGGIVAPAGSASAGYLEGNIQGNSTAAEALTTSGTLTTATTQYAYFKIRLINGTGTSLKIQATKLVGGTITPLAGSYWRCTRLPAANVGIFAA